MKNICVIEDNLSFPKATFRRPEEVPAVAGASPFVIKEIHLINSMYLKKFCEKKRVTFSYEEDGKYLLVRNVPAEVCTKCGEKTYSPEVTGELLRFAKKDLQPTKIVEVPVFDFAEMFESKV